MERTRLDLIYYFQQNYLQNLRRKTQHHVVDTSQNKISKSQSTHIPSIQASNLFDAYMKDRQQKREQLQLKPLSKSTKQLNQILIANRQLIRKQRISSIPQQPEKSLEQLITRKRSTNLTDIQAKKFEPQLHWLTKQPKIHRNNIKQARQETIFRESFNRINGWQIDNEQDNFDF